MNLAWGIIRQFLVFCGVGAFNTVVGLAVVLFLSQIGHWHYMAANFAGYMIGLAIGFVMQRAITFRSTVQAGYIHAQIGWFITVFALAYLCQLAALYWMVQGLGWNKAVSQIIACGLYTMLNFAGNKLKTFRSTTSPGA